MIKRAIVCDSCGVEKKNSNHWFTIIRGLSLIIDIGIEEKKNSMHVCGMNCAARIFDDWAQERIKEETFDAIQRNGQSESS